MLVLAHGDSPFLAPATAAWDCAHYGLWCHVHAAGISPWAIAVFAAYGLIALRMREEGERPRYSCPQCGTKDGTHSDRCSFRD